ncbi:universal stress protein UspA-like protein [Burkholderiales bacterium JOSHI_001]|nr:universal stress protein UspA-like protein [Burkholderiales bacterium JOSHI_001]
MYKKLFVPVDGSELSERAMQASVDLAKQLGAAIHGFVAEPELPLPTVGTHPSAYSKSSDEHMARTDAHAQNVLKCFEKSASESGVAFSGSHSRTDNVDNTIVDMAQGLGCDMIVMVTHGRGAFGELLFGSHTKNVLSRCKMPVLVLH